MQNICRIHLAIGFVGQNLLFLGKVEAVAEPLGYEVPPATTDSGSWEDYAIRRRALILVELEGAKWRSSKLLKNIDHQAAGGVKVVAFGPHKKIAVLDRSRKQGYGLVLNNSEFNRELPKIIERIRVDSG